MRDLELLLVGLLIGSTGRRVDQYTVSWRVDPKLWDRWWRETHTAGWEYVSLDEYADICCS